MQCHPIWPSTSLRSFTAFYRDGHSGNSAKAWSLLRKASSAARASSGRVRRTHSQTTATRQPMSWSLETARASRAAFAPIFVAHHSVRVLGRQKKRHPAWPCQKHPCTKMTAFQRGRTTSGRPKSSLACSRKRKPARCSQDLTTNSGLVFVPRMPDIIRDRVSGLIFSAMGLD